MLVNKISKKIAEGRILVSDGAWGTYLHMKGLKSGECPELWNVEHPDDVLDIALSYVEAGADIILTNSFGGSPLKLEGYGLSERAYELNRKASDISRRAAGDRAMVMGSIGPTGKMIMMGEVPPQEVYVGFMEQARGLADGGADAIVVETMSDPEEARIAIEAVKKVTELEVACTFTFSRNQDGVYRTMMGTDVVAYMEMARAAGADIIGANCGNGTAGMIEIVRAIRAIDPVIPVLVHANAGLPVYREGQTVFPESPGEMASQIKELVVAGANIVGGCCGTTPEHIRQIAMVVGQLSE
jgi:5-methyltetrahydrofolate--homocysteine methyltransferase